MPVKKEQLRDYKIDDANLIITTKSKIGFMRRDIAKLGEFGFTNQKLTTFEAQATAFENFPTDKELLGMQVQATELKDAKAAEVIDAIEQIMGRAKTKYGLNSGRYRTFATGDLHTWDNANLLIVGRRVVRIGNIYLSDLAPLGLTAAILSNLTTLCNNFEDLILSKDIKVGERDVTQEDRVEMGNAIFAQLKDYCRLAKTAWRTIDAAKYNDYLIYDTPSGTAAEGEPPLEDPEG